MKLLLFLVTGFTIAASAGAAEPTLSIESVKTFKLEQPWVYQWEKEKPQVQQATLLVVQARPEIIQPQQGFEAVILVEDRVAERVRILDKNRMVMIVPGLISKSALIWLGPQALPEDIDQEQRQRLFQIAKAEQKSQQSLMANLKEAIGFSPEIPIPKAKNISTARDLYKESDNVN